MTPFFTHFSTLSPPPLFHDFQEKCLFSVFQIDIIDPI